MGDRPTLASSLRSFYRRRIAIPVGATDLVLDVGSGDKPHWRADVLLDRYLGTEHGGQRSGRAAARIDRPLFDADASSMPFADGVFDYVVCSHVLEHVVDPAAVVAELTRVGRAGYLEVPEAASAKILDFPSHLWWCRSHGTRLELTAKRRPAFDPEIQGFIDAAGIERRLADLLDADFDRRVVALHWSGHIELDVVGTPPRELVDAAMAADAHHRSGQQLVARALTTVMSLPLRARHRRAPVLFDDVVKDEFRTGRDEVLSPRVYRCDSSSGAFATH
ncbi:MAG: class I SAM-dependent methyltransferase [Ilumatobacteraceae bacterium]